MIDRLGGICKIHVSHTACGNDMNMAMRDFKAGDHDANSFAGKRPTKNSCQSMRDLHEMQGGRAIKVAPVVNFLTWNHETVSWGNRIDRKQDDALIVGVGNVSRKFTCNDASKDAGHRPKLARWVYPLGTVRSCEF